MEFFKKAHSSESPAQTRSKTNFPLKFLEKVQLIAFCISTPQLEGVENLDKPSHFDFKEQVAGSLQAMGVVGQWSKCEVRRYLCLNDALWMCQYI